MCSKNEIELLQSLELIDRRRREADYNNWQCHYRVELNNLYKNIGYKFDITYEEFVKLAYNCTEVQFNDIEQRYTRLLY